MTMSYARSFLPEFVNNNVMYVVGKARCFLQGYINNTFSASEINSRLFVGDLASASNCEAMKEQGITHVVSIINGAFELFPDSFKYKLIHINDDPWSDIGKFFDETNEFIDEALSNPETKIIVHCQRGISRSVTLVLAYMLYKANSTKQIPLDEIDQTIKDILKEIKAHRPIAEPNKGFVDSLKQYIVKLNNYECKESEQVVEPTNETEFIEPIATAEPAELTETAEPTESIESTELTESTESNEIESLSTETV